METLPKEMIVHIMGFLCPHDIYKWKSVNHYYNGLFNLETIKLADWFDIDEIDYRLNQETLIDKEDEDEFNTYAFPFLNPIEAFHIYIWFKELVESDTMIISFPFIHCWSYENAKVIRTVEELKAFFIKKELHIKTIRLVTKSLGDKILNGSHLSPTRGRIKTYS